MESDLPRRVKNRFQEAGTSPLERPSPTEWNLEDLGAGPSAGETKAVSPSKDSQHAPHHDSRSTILFSSRTSFSGGGVSTLRLFL